MNDGQKKTQIGPDDSLPPTEPGLDIPQKENQDGWQMPKPIFRCSSGKSLQDIKKSKAGLDVTGGTAPPVDIGDRTMAFTLPADADESFEKAPPVAGVPLPQPRISDLTAAPPPAPVGPDKTKAAAAKNGGFGWLLLLGGLFLFFALVLVGILGAYFFYFKKLF